MRNLYVFLTLFFMGSALNCNSQTTPTWTSLASGIWKCNVGTPERITLTNQLGIQPKLEAINAMPPANLPIDRADIRFEQIDGKTYIRFPLDHEEKIFGLGLNFKTVEQRGRIMRLHVDHYGGSDDGRTHAPVPFFVSSKGYGAFINSARYIDVYVGTGVRKDTKNPPVVMDRNTNADWSAQPYSDNLELLVPAQGVEVILFAGKDMLDVVRRYNLYNGGGTIPPKWGLGFWHRVPTLFNEQQVAEEVAEFETRGFPLSVIGLEPGWMSYSYPCSYEWDKGRFPDPEAFVSTMAKKDIKVNVWINPGVAPVSEVYREIEPYTCSHTEWNGIIPDYTMPEARTIMGNHFQKNVLNVGVSGYKMDENDGFDSWIFPDVATFPSGTSAEQMRQIYGSLMQKFTSDSFRARNQRSYGLVRAGNGGTSSFPYVIYNDYYKHRDFITALINSSFIGVLWTPEVRASASSDEWLRRMQTVCFSPLAMLNAWSDGTKPWTFPDVEQQVNQVALLRMQLIPYIYTSFANYAFYGTPPIRAMNLEPGFVSETKIEKGKLDATENPYAMAVKQEMKDQYMFGDCMLVAPLFEGEKQRKVTLPQGKWFDFYTGKYVGEGEVITSNTKHENIPVYVRDGGIVPMLPPHTKINDVKMPLEIRHYGNASGVYALYDDDGKTFDYEKGKYSRIQISVDVLANGKKQGKCAMPSKEQLWSYNGKYIFKFMTE